MVAFNDWLLDLMNGEAHLLHIFFSGDVLCALDFLSQELALDAVSFAQWPTRCKAALLHENIGLTCTASIPGSDAVKFAYNSCLKMGSIDAPPVWRWTMIMCLVLLVPIWVESGHGFDVDNYVDYDGDVVTGSSFVITHFLFADHIWLVAKDHPSLMKMVTSLGALLLEKR